MSHKTIFKFNSNVDALEVQSKQCSRMAYFLFSACFPAQTSNKVHKLAGKKYFTLDELFTWPWACCCRAPIGLNVNFQTWWCKLSIKKGGLRYWLTTTVIAVHSFLLICCRSEVITWSWWTCRTGGRSYLVPDCSQVCNDGYADHCRVCQSLILNQVTCQVQTVIHHNPFYVWFNLEQTAQQSCPFQR